jgi:hypothetical protein
MKKIKGLTGIFELWRVMDTELRTGKNITITKKMDLNQLLLGVVL